MCEHATSVRTIGLTTGRHRCCGCAEILSVFSTERDDENAVLHSCMMIDVTMKTFRSEEYSTLPQTRSFAVFSFD